MIRIGSTVLSGRCQRYAAVVSRTSVILLAFLLVSPLKVLGDVTNEDVAKLRTSGTPLRVVYFHSSTCLECKRVKDFLPQVTGRWGDRIALELRSVDDINVFTELFKYEKHYNATVSAPPAIFVGDQALVGDHAIIKQLNAAIEDALERQIATFNPEAAAGDADTTQTKAVRDEILRLFGSFASGAIAVAGLFDGINPCAFTTIVFFLSMLAYHKKARRDMIIVGAGFAVGMFAAKFTIGLGLLGAVKAFSVHHGVTTGLGYVVAGMAFILAGWSFLDAVRYMRTGDVKRVTLGLPKKVKDKIHTVIRTGLTTRGLVIGSLSVGFLVSILESLCTGQVYLPTIMFIINITGDSNMQVDQDMRTSAILYLLLYNVMFIVPLLVIMTITYFGVRSETLGNMLRKRLAFAKFGMAALFAGLGVLVIMTL